MVRGIPLQSPSPFEFALLESDLDHLKASALNLLFMVWRRRTLADAYRRAIVIARDLVRRHPEGIGVCQIIDTEAVPPDAPARVAIVDLMKLPGVKHLSLTYDAGGFKAAAVRAVTLATYALARPTAKVTVHATLGDAARWHEAREGELGHHEPSGRIEATLRDLRERHRAQYP
jgi:hypothetical protein